MVMFLKCLKLQLHCTTYIEKVKRYSTNRLDAYQIESVISFLCKLCIIYSLINFSKFDYINFQENAKRF